MNLHYPVDTFMGHSRLSSFPENMVENRCDGDPISGPFIADLTDKSQVLLIVCLPVMSHSYDPSSLLILIRAGDTQSLRNHYYGVSSSLDKGARNNSFFPAQSQAPPSRFPLPWSFSLMFFPASGSWL